MPKGFNHNLLLVARQARGFSQAALAEKLAVTQGHYSKLENGLSDPPVELVERIASALDYPVSFFAQDDSVYGLPVSVHPMFRRKASVGERELQRLHAEFNLRLMHLRRLLRPINLNPHFPIPNLDLDEQGGDPEKIAELVRRTWLVPPGPIENLTDIVEKAGALVVWIDFGGADIDGVTLCAPGLPPCIFLNPDRPADRMRQSLAHEIGHVVMHKLPSPTMEEEATAFGGALLVPASEIKRDLAGFPVTLQRLAALKPKWRVSMQSLAVRAHHVGTIGKTEYQSLFRQFNFHKIRMREPPELDFPREQPDLLPSVIRLHLKNLGYSVAEIATAVHLHEAEFRRMYAMPDGTRHGHLRIVT
jgi:Zn-dependent peptidase ImmA (M78 family)/transcriptional regulator with XRE-family HTH domain